MRKLKIFGTWVLQILLGLMFVLVGTGKFVDPSWARRFAAWGYPPGFYLVVGVLETLGGLLLFWPRATTYAAALLGSIMIAAALTHLLHGEETARLVAPLINFALLGVLGAIRRRSAFRPAGVSGSSELERV
jgi:uncharacterized membrane protein YphA (DoxX/SURF4 family)